MTTQTTGETPQFLSQHPIFFNTPMPVPYYFASPNNPPHPISFNYLLFGGFCIYHGFYPQGLTTDEVPVINIELNLTANPNGIIPKVGTATGEPAFPQLPLNQPLPTQSFSRLTSNLEDYAQFAAQSTISFNITNQQRFVELYGHAFNKPDLQMIANEIISMIVSMDGATFRLCSLQERPKFFRLYSLTYDPIKSFKSDFVHHHIHIGPNTPEQIEGTSLIPASTPNRPPFGSISCSNSDGIVQPHGVGIDVLNYALDAPNTFTRFYQQQSAQLGYDPTLPYQQQSSTLTKKVIPPSMIAPKNSNERASNHYTLSMGFPRHLVLPYNDTVHLYPVPLLFQHAASDGFPPSVNKPTTTTTSFTTTTNNNTTTMCDIDTSVETASGMNDGDEDGESEIHNNFSNTNAQETMKTQLNSSSPSSSSSIHQHHHQHHHHQQQQQLPLNPNATFIPPSQIPYNPLINPMSDIDITQTSFYRLNPTLTEQDLSSQYFNLLQNLDNQVQMYKSVISSAQAQNEQLRASAIGMMLSQKSLMDQLQLSQLMFMQQQQAMNQVLLKLVPSGIIKPTQLQSIKSLSDRAPPQSQNQGSNQRPVGYSNHLADALPNNYNTIFSQHSTQHHSDFTTHDLTKPPQPVLQTNTTIYTDDIQAERAALSNKPNPAPKQRPQELAHITADNRVILTQKQIQQLFWLRQMNKRGFALPTKRLHPDNPPSLINTKPNHTTTHNINSSVSTIRSNYDRTITSNTNTINNKNNINTNTNTKNNNDQSEEFDEFDHEDDDENNNTNSSNKTNNQSIPFAVPTLPLSNSLTEAQIKANSLLPHSDEECNEDEDDNDDNDGQQQRKDEPIVRQTKRPYTETQEAIGEEMVQLGQIAPSGSEVPK